MAITDALEGGHRPPRGLARRRNRFTNPCGSKSANTGRGRLVTSAGPLAAFQHRHPHGAAARARDHDLRALRGGPPGRLGAEDGRPRALPRRPDPATCAASAPQLPEVSEPEIVRHYPPLAPQLRPRHRAVPARLVHDEAQPALNERRGPARPRAPAPRPVAGAGAGGSRPHVAPGAIARRSAACRTWPAALGRLAGELAGCSSPAPTTRTAARSAPRVDAGHLTRDEPRVGDDGRPRGGEGRRPTSGWGDLDDLAVHRRARRLLMSRTRHARRLRREHHGMPESSTPAGDPLLRRRKPEHDHGPQPPATSLSDIVHVNLHKSFSQPHGRWPGAGPIAVSDRVAPTCVRASSARRAAMRLAGV